MIEPTVKYTGTPCNRCGQTERYDNNRACVRCTKERTARWQKTSPKYKEYLSRPEVIEARRRRDRIRGPKRSRSAIENTTLKYRYGITRSQRNEILESQGGVCAICGIIPEKKTKNPWHVDHDHETDLVRGVLCMQCNHTLGRLGDNLEGLEKFYALAKAYLIRSRA